MSPLVLACALSCGGGEPTLVIDSGASATDSGATAASGATSPPERVSDLAWLARLSLDLRGVRPSADEIARVQDDPNEIDALIDEYLADPRLPERVGWVWNDSLHTAVWPSGFARFGDWNEEQWRAVGAEPLRLISTVISEERPISDILTEDRVVADPVLADLWGIPHPTGSGWEWTAYTDGRPMAGVLSTNTLWLRYTADAVNYNRHRANAVARVFLCADFLEREGGFTFAVSAESLSSVERAVTEESACLTCHAALDPLASFLGGFAQRSVELPLDRYITWSQHTADWFAARVPPAYFGAPGSDIADMGAMMAADPRFSACAARRVAEGLLRDSITGAEAARMGSDLRAEGMLLRPLIRQVVTSDAYRSPEPRLLTTEQLGSALSDALGWGAGATVEDGLEALSWSAEHRVMGGGTDDDTVLFRNDVPGVGLLVLLTWTARQAAQPALEADLARGESDRVLLGTVDDLPADEATGRALIADWHARLLTSPVDTDSAQVDALWTLWSDAGGSDDLIGAWSEVLGALIRHPLGVVY